MTRANFEKLTRDEVIDIYLDKLDSEGYTTVSEDCFAVPVGDYNRPKYTVVVDGIADETTAYRYGSVREDYDHDTNEVPIGQVLADYGVDDVSDLPTAKKSCSVCPYRYDCGIILDNWDRVVSTLIDDDND